LDFRPMI